LENKRELTARYVSSIKKWVEPEKEGRLIKHFLEMKKHRLFFFDSETTVASKSLSDRCFINTFDKEKKYWRTHG
jgi:hypothetical protein